MNRSGLGFTLAAFSLFLCACSVTESDNVKSKGIYATHEVQAMNQVAVCKSTLRVGGGTGTFIELSGSDQLHCGDVRMTKQRGVAGEIWYQATVPYRPGSMYQLRLTRSDESLGAAIRLPSEIVDAKIDGGIDQKIAQPFSVSWQKSADVSETTIAVLNLQNQRRDSVKSTSLQDGAPETGRVNFRASDTVITELQQGTQHPSRVPGPYLGEVEITRATSGSLSGSWSGVATGAQMVKLGVSFQD